jgi:hypothetical protein
MPPSIFEKKNKNSTRCRKGLLTSKIMQCIMPISAKWCRHEIFDECTLDDNLSTFHSAFLINKTKLFAAYSLMMIIMIPHTHSHLYTLIISKSIKLIILQLPGKKYFWLPTHNCELSSIILRTTTQITMCQTTF